MATDRPNPAERGSLIELIREGLLAPGQKELPCRYLYDEVGSALFEVICALPEYGLARAGERLLRRYSDDIVRRLPRPLVVAELGSGSGRRTRWILQALSDYQKTVYCPIELSPTALAQCERELSAIDRVSVLGLEREYLDGLRAVAAQREPGEHLLVLFLGSTIGNFSRPAGVEFLKGVRAILAPGDAMLLAADLVKAVPVMLLAYDDPLGVTAAFNLNLLARLNREFGANFDLSRFRHEARWSAGERRIEMHLVSLARQTVEVTGGGFAVSLEKDETIWTESSHKYTTEEVGDMAGESGFRCELQWVDREWPFVQSLLTAV